MTVTERNWERGATEQEIDTKNNRFMKIKKEERELGTVSFTEPSQRMNLRPWWREKPNITSEEITDEGFLDFCVDEGYVDEEGHVLREKTEAMTELNVNDQDIASLEGLRFFPALEELYCIGNRLTTLDTSVCPALRVLDCSGNELTRLNVAGNPALVYLDCTWNCLTDLDVSQTLRSPDCKLYCGYQCKDKEKRKKQKLTLTLSELQRARGEERELMNFKF